MIQSFDLIIIGGGINGCGIAADAAMRGLKTLLIEKDDLASKTSSSSTKLIHGGLRYLEHYDFSLVRKALTERQTLLNIAPHLVHPIAIALPQTPSLRASWLLRAGLFLYDNLSRNNKLPHSLRISPRHHANIFMPLQDRYQSGFLFYDALTDDAQLTISIALEARQYGATIMPYTSLLSSHTQDHQWQLTLKAPNNPIMNVSAPVLINATGPWVSETNTTLGIANDYPLALVQGSHLVVKKLYDGDHAYLLQHTDHRVVFVIPYHDFSMIGTTEVKQSLPLEKPHISPQEIHYLLELVNTYFKKTIKPADIINSWSGLRPLIEQKNHSPQELTRDYALHLSTTPATSLVVYGGKITTFRQLAEDCINKLQPIFPNLSPCRTAQTPLPGSQTVHNIDFKQYQQQLTQRYPWLNATLAERLFHDYGTRIERLLKNCTQMADLGQHFGHGLYQTEVGYLIDEEWAHNEDDILWRRTKLGLMFTKAETEKLRNFILSR